MKYLKLFENHNQYYKEISDDEYHKYLSQEVEEFNDGDEESDYTYVTVEHEIDSLPLDDREKKLLMDLFSKRFEVAESNRALSFLNGKALFVDKPHLFLWDQISCCIYILNKPKLKIEVYISKLEDEWFLVQLKSHNHPKTIDTTYIKCDQFEGLLEYFKYKFSL